jgi:hypothetical protein
MKTLLNDLKACQEAVEWVGDRTLEEAWRDCERGDWMLWLYARLHPDNVRERVLAAGHCANTVRHLMTDARSVAAVDMVIAYGEGRASREELNTANAARDDAAWTAADAAWTAADAARAAAWTAAWIVNQKQTAEICRRYLTI